MSNTPPPVILCHVACSGGSLIYRLLVSATNSLGVSEVGHRSKVAPTAFLPADPMMQLRAQGIVSDEEFQKEFLSRIKGVIEFAAAREQRLLIREHTHDYFFEGNSPYTQGVSWIADHIEDFLTKPVPVIFSTRDPIDSWLSQRTNFPRSNPKSFSEYCERYLLIARAIQRAQTQNRPLFVLKYEELLEQPEELLNRVRQFVGITEPLNEIPDFANVASSGKSGRQSDKLGQRSRRPFDYAFYNETKRCEPYAELCQILGYPTLSEQLPKLSRASATGRAVRHSALATVRTVTSAMSRLRRLRSRLAR